MLFSIRPGAAVRFKGEWRTSGHLTTKSGDASNIAEPPSSTQATEVPAEDEKLAAPELQVSEVEILGSSDPQVRAPSAY